jgi:hypothetical protein
VRRQQAVVLGLATAGLFAAPSVAQVTGETRSDPVPAEDESQGAQREGGQAGSETQGPRGIVAPAGPVLFATESRAWEVIRGDSTSATAFIVLEVACYQGRGGEDAESCFNGQAEEDAEEQVVVDPCADGAGLAIYGLREDGADLTREETESSPADGQSGYGLILNQESWPEHPMDGGPTRFCALGLQAQVAPDDPAAGWLLVANRGVATVENGQLREYRVARSSPWETFGWLTGIAAAIGLIGTLLFVAGPLVKDDSAARHTKVGLRARARRELPVPKDHPLRESWVSSLAAVGAAATTLLAASGALSQLAPQYQTGKVVIGNVLVVTLLAIAAAFISAGRRDDQVKLGYAVVAVFAAISGIAAQLLLTALVLIHSSTHWPVRLIVVIAAVITLGFLLYSGRVTGRRLPSHTAEAGAAKDLAASDIRKESRRIASVFRLAIVNLGVLLLVARIRRWRSTWAASN